MRNSLIGGVAVLSLFLIVANIVSGDELSACAGSGGAVSPSSPPAVPHNTAASAVTAAVPEPATIVILGLGAVVLFIETRRHRY